MEKEFLKPLSGFRDYDKPTKDRVLSAIRQTFQLFGYQSLETPSLERQEVLLGKLGEENQKQLYLFDDNGGRKVGLRYDLTVSLARYIARNFGSLIWPYKRFEIGNVWRAERAQQGRLRQFTQADADVVGANDLAAEKELLAIMARVDKELDLRATYLLNDRRLAETLMAKINIPQEKQARFLQVIDKARKVSEERLDDELLRLGLSDNQLKQARLLFLADDEADLERLDVAPELKQPLERLVGLAQQLGLKARVDLGMVRGLDYYTGVIIEAVGDDYPSSIAGGGRYDNLIEQFGGKPVSAVGISFGVDRIVDLLDNRSNQSVTTLFLACLPETEDELRVWADDLRGRGRGVEVYLDSSVELGKQLKYADKRGFSEVYLPFTKEWKRGQVTKRNLETGEQTLVERDSV